MRSTPLASFRKTEVSGTVSPIIRVMFYLFVLAIPLETAFMESSSSIGTVPMMIGMAFAGTALLQPRICFSRPPAAFWCFAGYLFVCLILGMTQDLIYAGRVVSRLLSLAQLLLLMWISINLFKYPEISKGALLALIASCTVLAIFMVTGTSTVDSGQGRSTLFGDHVNTLAAMLALAIIALVGMTYGRIKVERKLVILAWMLFPLLGTALIMTGSRGSLLGLLLGIALLVTRDGEWGSKLKIGVVVVLAIGFLVWVALTDDAMRARLDRSWHQGDTAGRDRILDQAWDMFLEEPVLGWGPVRFRVELGSRVGWIERDAHNLYLSVLIETGLLGAIPFFAGLVLAVKAAWKARVGREGASPIAILGFLLLINLSSTWHNRKLFWLTLAYAVASVWSVRETARSNSTQSFGSSSDMVPGSGLSTSFPQADNAVLKMDPVRRQSSKQ